MLATFIKSYCQSKWDQVWIRSEKTLKRVQQKRWQAFKKNVLPYSPFYQSYINQPLSAFPIMDKTQMLEHFDEMNTLGIQFQTALDIALKAEKNRDFSPTLNGVSVGLSSGTSGHRGLFIVSPYESAYWAGSLLAKALPNPLWQHERIAFFLRANNNLYQTINQSKKLSFHYFDLIQSLSEQIETLEKLNPTILSAPATVLLELAYEKQKGKINISPHSLFSVAEVLEPIHQTFIEKTFKCCVRQIYQCTEGCLGISPKSNTNIIQLNEENIIIEKQWLDTSRFIPIITDLRRRSQPIIRYRLDDILQVAPNSTTPFCQLKKIEGREGDICYGLSIKNNTKQPVFSDVIRQSIAQLATPIKDYQIQQLTPDLFSISVLPEPTEIEKNQIDSQLNMIFSKLKCQAPTWQWQPMQLTKRHNKKRRIQCLLTNKEKS